MKTEQQQQAQNLYLHSNMTQAEIADLLDIGSRTLYLWIRKGKWDQMKKAASQVEELTLEMYYNHIQAINDSIQGRENKIPTFQEVSMLSKLQKMAQFSTKYHTSMYMQSFEELLRFISAQDHELCKKVAPYADEFIQGNFANPRHLWAATVKNNVERVLQNRSDGTDSVNIDFIDQNQENEVNTDDINKSKAQI